MGESLWRHRDFRQLWIAQTLSLVGSQFGGLALPLVAILVLGASPAQVGLLTGIAGVPWLLIGLAVGVVVDRVRRRRLLVHADLGRGMALSWVPVAAAFGVLSMAQLYVVAFVVGICAVFFETAYQSYLPSIVARQQLVEGTSRLAVTESITGVAGPSAAGAVIQLLGATVGVLIDAASYVASALALATIYAREAVPSAGVRQRPKAALAEGMTFLWRQVAIRSFALSNATFMLFSTVLQAVVLVYYTRSVGLSAALIGVTYASGNAGAIVGALLARRAAFRGLPGLTISGSSTLRALGLVAIPVTMVLPRTPALVLIIVGQFVHAFGWSLWSVHQGSTRQFLAPVDVRGRVNGRFLFIVRGTTAIGGFLGAALAQAVGVAVTITVGVAGTLAGTLWLLIAPVVQLRDQNPCG